MSDNVYHGSGSEIKKLIPDDKHGDTRVGKRVFATPHLAMALAYLGNKWGDRDISQVSNNKNWQLTEMRPGAFKEIYHNKTGYLHHLPGDKFIREPTRGSKWEVTSKEEVTPIKIEKITNIIKRLKDAGVVLNEYDPKSRQFKSALKFMKKRISEMEDPSEYIKWVHETNPNLKL